MASPANEPILLKQYKLLGAVIDSSWATRLDHKVARVVIDRYFAKHGNARVSLRYLEVATSATRTNVIASTRRLIEQGVIEVTRKGVGTRPTEYGPIFGFAEVIANPQKPFANYNNLQPALPSGPADNTSKSSTGIVGDTSTEQSSGLVGDTTTSGPVGNTSCGPVGNTASAARGPVGDTESYLRSSLTSELTVMVLTVLGMVAEMELGFTRERQTAGIAKAKIKGVYKGRPVSLDHERIRALRLQGLGATAIAEQLGCSRGAVYKAINSAPIR